MTIDPTLRRKSSIQASLPEEYRALAESALDVVVLSAENRRISWVTPSVSRVLGWDAAELIGTTLADLLHPDDLAATELERALTFPSTKSEWTTTPFIVRFRTSAGAYVWMSGTATSATDPVTGAARVITGMHNVEGLVAAADVARDSEAKYRLIAENASDIVTLVAADGTLEWISPSVSRILGWEPADLVGSRPWGIIHPEDREAASQSFAEASVPKMAPPPIQLRFRRSDGDFVWLSAKASRTDEGRFLVSYRRVEDQVQAERALLQSEARFRLLSENAQDLVFSLDTKAIIQWVSPSSFALLGYQPDELVGKFGGVLINQEDLPILLDTATEAREGRPATCRIRLRTAAGADRWVQAVPRALLDEAGTLVGGVIGASDIHDEVLARQALQHEVNFDDLTGLAKRPLALARIQEVLDSRGASGWALLCVGVDGMTAANQAYTYVAGDAILRSVADRLVTAAGQPDRVARIAGDEFAVLLPDVQTASDAVNAAERILAAVRGPVTLAEAHLHVTACLGVAFWSGQSADALLRDAVAAMRQGAAQGPDRWAFLDGDAGEHARERLNVQAALTDGLSRGRVEPWLMPVVRLTDGRVVGYEALARWRHPDGSVWDAGSFIDIAEHTGLIIGVDDAVLTQSLNLIKRIPADQHVAVNVSAATLAGNDFAESVITALARAEVAPRRLHLEVTETLLLQVTDRIRTTMQVLADLGVVWWVDDFGTGFSSISHLRDLPIAGLKLDMSFTRDLSLDDNHATSLARGLAGLASGLGLATIAEGVETQEQVQVLIAQGWQMGQGALFGPATGSTDPGGDFALGRPT